ncbi:unnamed protein product [Acanthoscelides obtectus]|uniref:Chitin-binding type-2 domain-containing protein n=1 Tax=Acanthoscelides obtectus TaxID=200917 RepID=A0A9P0KKC1_ACAOB|nr:unnamed protein product [Acanthoscelides obtectus]CAK1635207.1 hypothetical protein AOBTE_LOCUS9138 [Acanthoscelides obtectus]
MDSGSTTTSIKPVSATVSAAFTPQSSKASTMDSGSTTTSIKPVSATVPAASTPQSSKASTTDSGSTITSIKPVSATVSAASTPQSSKASTTDSGSTTTPIKPVSATVPVASTPQSSKASTTDSRSTTTSIKPVDPPNCYTVGKGTYPALYCNLYYECLDKGVLHVFERYKRALRRCEGDLIYDDSSKSCIVGTCTSLSVAPYCARSGKHPAEKCNQFYQCTRIGWHRPIFDYELQLKTCGFNKIFDPRIKRCVPGSCR